METQVSIVANMIPVMLMRSLLDMKEGPDSSIAIRAMSSGMKFSHFDRKVGSSLSAVAMGQTKIRRKLDPDRSKRGDFIDRLAAALPASPKKPTIEGGSSLEMFGLSRLDKSLAFEVHDSKYRMIMRCPHELFCAARLSTLVLRKRSATIGWP
jgi:hypothetical protein